MSKTSSTSSVTRALPAESRAQRQAAREPNLRRRSSSKEGANSVGKRPKNEGVRPSKERGRGEAAQGKSDALRSSEATDARSQSAAASSKLESEARGSRAIDRRDEALEEGGGVLEGAGLEEAQRALDSGFGDLQTDTRVNARVEARELDHDLSRPAASSRLNRPSTERGELARAAMVSDPRGRFDLQELRSVRVQLEHGVTMQFSQNSQGASSRLQSKHALGAHQRDELRAAVGQHGYTLEERGEDAREGGSND